MTTRLFVASTALIFVVGVSGVPTAWGQEEKSASWEPAFLADGQPDIQGIWNNIDALSTPLELPEGFSGPTFTPEDLQDIAEARAAEAAVRAAQPRAPSVGAYGAYWFDSYWNEAGAAPAPARIVEPLTGQIPDYTAAALAVKAENEVRLHDSYEFMESADRCITRGVISIMSPGVYNNGAQILQIPGYVIIYGEMIHRARIIPLDGRAHVADKIRQWEGDPRGRWEGNTLVVESTNFRHVRSMRAETAGSRSVQSEQQRLIERLTIVGPDTLQYSVQVDDPNTYTGTWTASFPMERDNEYEIYEYACHEGNYSVENALSGARFKKE